VYTSKKKVRTIWRFYIFKPLRQVTVALEVENVFATGSSPLRIQELQIAFDSPNRYGKGVDWSDYAVHDAANILLRYLLQLPEPVIPLEYYERLCSPLRDHQAKIAGAKDDQWMHSLGALIRDSTIQTHRMLLAGLHPASKQLLRYLLDLLGVFAADYQKNKMSASRLATIFQPATISHPDHASSIADRQLSQIVVRFMMEEQDSLMMDTPDNAADRGAAEGVQK
jgi:hypothetical protein